MVCGDIDDQPLPPEPAPAPIEAEPFEDDSSKGLAAFWPTPAVCADDFDEVSALRASMADDAAPRAKNMTGLQQGRTVDGRQFVHADQQAPCQWKKPNKTGLFCASSDQADPAIAARRGRFFRLQQSERRRIAPGPPPCYAGTVPPL
jgi:hypothetical protein